jgi:hopene-associated glycosyltransferase HpnB
VVGVDTPPLAALAVVSACVWGGLVALRGRYWRLDRRLPQPRAVGEWPPVVAVVPARDEAAMLPATLPTVLAQDYPGPYRVVLVDDHSADGTAALARALASAHGHDDRLRVVSAPDRPPGWVGKVWALRQGVDVAVAESPRFVLFTDADIAHPPDSVRRLVTAAQDGDLDLVSLMVLLRCETRWERLLVPAFVYFFARPVVACSYGPTRWSAPVGSSRCATR